MSDGVDNDITTEKEKFMVIPYWIEPIKEDTISQNSCDSIFEIGEKMPMFIGGNSELMTYNWDKVIPLVGQSNNRTGILITKLHYSLIISKEGEVLDVEILTKVEEKRLEDELETELLNMPDWIPGEVNGKPECFRIRVPISCMKWQ